MSVTRVLVTDDSAFMRSAIRRILSAAADIEVVGVARNGIEAIDQARQLQPDLITLDIEMPEMDGLTALPQLRRVCSAPVLMISSLTKAGSQATLSALRLGAADFIAKAQSQVSLQLGSIDSQLVAKVRQLGGSHRRSPPPAAATPADERRAADLFRRPTRIVAIVSSTGGPPVLEKIVAGLPAGFRCPIVIAQHMPALFTEAMAERFDQIGPLRVVHARHGQRIEPGCIYIAPGAQHTRIRNGVGRGLWLQVSDEPAHLLYKPSADELLRSAGEACGADALGIVLTGMGEDGVVGARTLQGRGGRLIAQDHESCVVYGMPKAVVQAGLADASLSPETIVSGLKMLPMTQEPAAFAAN